MSAIDLIRQAKPVQFIHSLELFVRSIMLPNQVETAQQTVKEFNLITLHPSTQNHAFAVKLAIDIAMLGA